MDLLRAVLHEMGHLAGRPDQPGTGLSDGLMADALAPGVRRTQALDLVFAGSSLMSVDVQPELETDLFPGVFVVRLPDLKVKTH
jgi:hypothetical protein